MSEIKFSKTRYYNPAPDRSLVGAQSQFRSGAVTCLQAGFSRAALLVPFLAKK
jgi:hypothetical protein